MKENYPIDFVVTWLDGNDPVWQAEYKKYYKEEKGCDMSIARTRDWDNLHYWFRCVEKFAPWVRKIHFVTCGHLPEWLNTKAEKLNIVTHTDFIPAEYLPTFNTWTIVWNLWRIEGLSEHYIALGDDMFFGKNVEQKRFFRNGIPCDFAQLTAIAPKTPMGHYTLNTVEIAHRRHNVLKAIMANPTKWFNLKYGILPIWKTLSLFPWSFAAGFKNPHVAAAWLRTEFENLWQEEFAALDATCKSKFRNLADIAEWLVKYDRILKGDFVPHGIQDTMNDTISDQRAEEIADYIVKQKYSLFCINDSNDIVDFEKTKATINAAFEKLVPEKSSFEK